MRISDCSSDVCSSDLLGLDAASIRTSTISSLWLKIGAAAGLNLYQIASFVAAPCPSQASFLEQVLSDLSFLDLKEPVFRLVLVEQIGRASFRERVCHAV